MISLNNRRRVNSLYSMCMDRFADNLQFYVKDLESLPIHMKAILLKKLTTRPKHYNIIQFNQLFKCLVYPSLAYLDFTSVDADDDTYRILEMCHHLKRVHIRNISTKSQFEGILSLIKNNKELEIFDVMQNRLFSDDGLIYLAQYCPKLTTLYAADCSITDVGLMELVKCGQNLTGIDVSRTDVTNQGIKELVQNCPDIRELRMDNCQHITDEVLPTIAINCPKLEILTFFNCQATVSVEALSLFDHTGKLLKQFNWTINV